MRHSLRLGFRAFNLPHLRVILIGWLAVALLLLSIISSNANASGLDKKTGFFKSGPDQIYYELSGNGPPLVIPSGGSGMDLRQWDAVVPALSKDYTIILFDPRGIGKSDNPTVKYSDLQDMNDLVNHLGLNKVGLIGLSSSGGLVLEFTVRYPEKVAALVASAPFLPTFEFSNEMNARLNRFNQAAGKGKSAFLDSMMDDPHFFPAPLNRSIRLSARKNMGGNFDKGADFNPTLVIPVEQPLIGQLATVQSPTLLLVGELDHPEVHRRNKYILSKIRSSKEVVIVDAGHNSQLENPAGFLAALTPFLAEVFR